MSTNTIALALAAIVVIAATETFAQKKEDPKYTNYFKDPETVEGKQIVLEMRDGVSRIDFLKFRTKFTNNTNDFILVNPSKFTVKVNGATVHPKEKTFILDPNDSNGKTIDVKEGANFAADEFEVQLAGFERIPVDGEAVQMPEFQLPASVNVIKSGNFEVNLKNLKQETDETWARLEIKYKGDGYGIVDPSRISLKVESGQQFANDDRKSKTILLEKGESKTVNAIFHIPVKVVDMQFATLMVQWGESMIETKAVPFELDETVTFRLDEALTTEKNK
jgi:hypothetical protein